MELLLKHFHRATFNQITTITSMSITWQLLSHDTMAISVTWHHGNVCQMTPWQLPSHDTNSKATFKLI